MSSVQGKAFRLALVQLRVTADKTCNLQRVRDKVREAAEAGAQVVILPECFNSPYGTGFFRQSAERIPEGESCQALSSIARVCVLYGPERKQIDSIMSAIKGNKCISGSIPEISATRIFNTCTIWHPSGKLLGLHRKVHLFDIDVPGKIRFQESEVLSAGSRVTIVDTEYGKFGVGICYDMRFPELAMICARKGCVIMLYPGAFNMVTGPLHWELLQRARALDQQFYVATCAPARDTEATYIAWGHSTVVNPMGEIVSTTGHDEAIVYADIDPIQIREARENIPVHIQRRNDLYSDVEEIEQSIIDAPSKV